MSTALAETKKVSTPPHLRQHYRLHAFAAVFASVAATALFLAAYYTLFAFVPAADGVQEAPHLPGLDLAQFIGTLMDPPYPNHVTWWIGFIGLGGLLVGAGVLYAVLNAWATTRPTGLSGLGYGVGLFFALGLMISISSGFHPAITREALPDTGLFLLGWSGWATLALLASCAIYGGALGGIYRGWSQERPPSPHK